MSDCICVSDALCVFCRYRMANRRLRQQLAAERAKVALAVKACESMRVIYENREMSTLMVASEMLAVSIAALATLQSPDALAAVRPSPTLDQLIELARNYKWTEEDKKRFARSFAYGTIKMHNPDVTREIINAEADKLDMERVRSEVARECAEIVRKKAKDYSQGIDRAFAQHRPGTAKRLRSMAAALDKVAVAIRAKFGVTE